jgi:hypothetical protein
VAWGDKSIDQQKAWAAKFVPKSKEIWMTEWGYATWEGVPLADEADATKDKITNQAITGIFQVGYLMKMMESFQDTSQPFHTTGNHHLFNEQAGIGWGAGSGSTRMSKKANDMQGSSINGPGQMYSHMSYVALQLSNRMHSITGATCPSQGLTFLGSTSNMDCLYAQAFRHTCRDVNGRSAMPVYAIINRCTKDIYPTLPSATMSGSNNQLRTITYQDFQQGDWVPLAQIKAQGSYVHPWKNGPIKPGLNYRPVLLKEVGQSGTGVTVTVKQLSLTFVEFKEPTIANALPAGCPSISW